MYGLLDDSYTTIRTYQVYVARACYKAGSHYLYYDLNDLNTEKITAQACTMGPHNGGIYYHPL